MVASAARTVLLLLLPGANALIRSMPHHPAITAPFVRPPQLYLLGEYEGLAQALADVTALQSNTALEYCSSEQLADAPSETQLRALFESLDTDKDGYIDVPELRASKVTSLDPASMLRLADRNADSRISFAEFKDAFGGSQSESELVAARLKPAGWPHASCACAAPCAAQWSAPCAAACML